MTTFEAKLHASTGRFWPTPPPPDVMIELRGIGKSLGGRAVLQGIDLMVPEGRVVAIIGPSGSGKTTLLRCINFLERPDEGEVWVGGELVGQTERHGRLVAASERSLRSHRTDTGMVFQQFNLFRNMTVLQNVAFAPKASRGWSRKRADERARDLLRKVGLAEKANSYPSQLSGGQQQRVGIARALAMDPKVMLFDEVTSALDPELVGEVLAVMRQLAVEGMTMVVVTHEMTFARDVAHQIVFMDEGRVVDSGHPRDLMTSSDHPRIRAFLGGGSIGESDYRAQAAALTEKESERGL